MLEKLGKEIELIIEPLVLTIAILRLITHRFSCGFLSSDIKYCRRLLLSSSIL